MNYQKALENFNWDANPFSFKIIPEFFVGYVNDVSRIKRGLSNGTKFSVLIGPTGSGKTTLMMSLIKEFQKDKIIYISKPPKNPEDWINILKGISKPGFLSSIFSRGNGVDLYGLSGYVNEKTKNQRIFLFVDECHEASIESLEWLRTLTDQIDNLHIVLAGLPVLETMLKNNLETFIRRITTRIELTNLTKSETRELIKKRIEGMGGDDTKPFTQDAIDFIYEKTGGFPREILRACNELLEKAIEKNITTLDIDFLKETSEPETRVSLETINSLPDRQKMIMETLAANGELTPSEVISKLETDEYKDKENAVRSVNNLLRRLMNDKFVERNKIGKSYKYRVAGKFQTMMVSA
jgi:type II secretory pathway predicted ATPase ExeA